MKKTLSARVAELEDELAALKAAPTIQQHFHYHYPPYQVQPAVPAQFWPVKPYPYTVWNTTCGVSSGNSATGNLGTNLDSSV